jgi:hypothetical protein
LDNVNDEKLFHSCKGFYGLNVQAIVDRNEKVLFCSITSQGAEYDSTVFKHSSLYVC